MARLCSLIRGSHEQVAGRGIFLGDNQKRRNYLTTPNSSKRARDKEPMLLLGINPDELRVGNFLYQSRYIPTRLAGLLKRVVICC